MKAILCSNLVSCSWSCSGPVNENEIGMENDNVDVTFKVVPVHAMISYTGVEVGLH